MICLICNRDFRNAQGLSKHIKICHKLTAKQYYDMYVKSNDNKCPICGKETPFLSITKGYQKHCSAKCAQNSSSNKFISNNPRKHNHTTHKKQTFKIVDFTCKICGKTFNNNRAIVNHMKAHNISIQEYWKTYGSNICKICGQETKFLNASKGYLEYCCIKHRNLDLFGVETNLAKYNNKRKSVELLRNQFETVNDVISYQALIQTYGQGWLAIKNKLNFINFAGKKYLSKSEIYKIIKYVSEDHYILNKKEQAIVDSIKSVYNGVIKTHEKHIISPLELDVYIPDLKLAIEYNGNTWHCIENGRSKNYHLKKSIQCRNLGIRLIHIYEFENFDKQLVLLNNFILGKDEYPNDFNKNNFIKIPKPTIIYKGNFTIYGAGPLI